MNEQLKTLAETFGKNWACRNQDDAELFAVGFAQALIDSGHVVEASDYRDVCERLKQTLIPFGEWVIIDGDELNQGQVVDYDVLNNEYTVDKNGSWQSYKASSISKLPVSAQPQDINVPQWISVKDRLPEDVKPVWAIVKIGDEKLIPCVCLYTKGNEIEAEFDEGEGETYLNAGWYEETEQQRGTYDIVYFNREVVMWSHFSVNQPSVESNVSIPVKEVTEKDVFISNIDIINKAIELEREWATSGEMTDQQLQVSFCKAINWAQRTSIELNQFKSSPASTVKEISDSNVDAYANKNFPLVMGNKGPEKNISRTIFYETVKWYRDQLKQR